MKIITKSGRSVIIAGALLVCTALAGSSAQAASQYTIKDLGSLGGGSSSAADINASGLVVGKSTTSEGAEHAFVWNPTTGLMTDLGTLGMLGGVDYSFRSEATGINDRGEVVGDSCSNESVYSCVGFLWDPTTARMTDLGPPPSGYGDSPRPKAINDSGQIVGTVDYSFASWWNASNGWRSLDDPDRDSDAYVAAGDISNLGQIVGAGSPTIPGPDSGELEPYVFDLRTGHATFMPDGCCVDAGPFAVNERGQVVANFGFLGPPVVWDTSSGVVTSIGTPAVASDINESSQVVGTSSGAQHGFVWDLMTRQMTDLGTLGGATSEATAINDLGRIVGSSTTAAGQSRAVLWTPAASSSVVVTPSADTYVNEQARATNFGSSKALAVRGVTGKRYITYLRFALPAAPAGKTLTGVSLRVRTTGEAFAGSQTTQTVKLITGSWSETGTIFTTRPSLGPSIGTLAGATRPATKYTVSLDPAAVKGLLGANLNIAVTGTTIDDSLWINSRETSNASYRPTLTLSFTS